MDVDSVVSSTNKTLTSTDVTEKDLIFDPYLKNNNEQRTNFVQGSARPREANLRFENVKYEAGLATD